MNNKKIALIIFSILLLTTAYEFYNLTAMALWHDESFSALLLDYDFGEMMYRIGLDVHPPLYYILLRSWDFVFGNSLFSLRSFSVFFSILAVLVLYCFAKEAFKDKKLALFSAALLALNSFQMQFAMEARMFTFGIFLVILSSFFLLKALYSKKWHWWLFYAFAVSLGIYTHYYIFFSIFAQGIFLLYWIIRESKFNLTDWVKNKNFQFGFLTYLLVVLSYLPWLKTFLAQFSQVQETYWIPKMSGWSVPATFLKMTTGGGVDISRAWYILVALMIIVVAAIFYSLKKFKTPAIWLVFLLLIIPFLGATALSFKSSIYLDRYFIFVAPFYIILMAGAVLRINQKWLKNALILLFLLVSAVSFPLRWSNLNVDEKPGMAAASAYLNQEASSGDKIYVGSSFVYFTFKYYNLTGTNPQLYVPGPIPHFSGTALLSKEDIIKDFSQDVVKQDIVWMVNTTGFGNYQPSLPSNWIKKEEKGFQDVYDYRGWIIVSKYKVQ